MISFPNSNLIAIIVVLSLLHSPRRNSTVLLCTQREGFSKFNKIYEFRCRVEGRDCDMSMTSVSGHLLGLDFEAKYKGWRTVDPVRLFELPVQKQCPEKMVPIKVSWRQRWSKHMANLETLRSPICSLAI